MENYFGQYNFTGETDEDYLNDLIETEQLQNEGIVVLQVEVGDLQDGYSQEQFLSFKDGKTSWGLLKFLLEESDWSDFVNYRPAYDCLVFYPENPGMQLDTCFYDHALGE